MSEDTGWCTRNHESRIADLEAQLSACQQELEQLRVQLAGCGVAALGGTSADQVATPDAYGWSPAYQDTLDLRSKYEACQKERDRYKKALVVIEKYPEREIGRAQTIYASAEIARKALEDSHA